MVDASLMSVAARVEMSVSASDSVPDDDASGRDPAVVLSYPYWSSRLGGNPDVVGGKILLNG